LWDNHGKLLHELRGHRTDVTEAAFSPDGRHILTTSKDGTTKLWDLEGNILTDWVSGPNALVQFLPNETAMLTVMNGGRSVARIPFPEQIYGQMNRQDVLDSASAKAVLEEFKVQFLDALTARQ
jgi:WD40 repeat protein